MLLEIKAGEAIVKVKDGEATLDAKLFESDSLNEVIQQALGLGLACNELRIDRVRTDGRWVSTDESTVPAAVLYLTSNTEKEGHNAHLITKRSEEEKYGLYECHWIP